MDFPLTHTQYGFQWGPAQITRIFSDPNRAVILSVVSSKERVEIRVTKGGMLRIGPVTKLTPAPRPKRGQTKGKK